MAPPIWADNAVGIRRVAATAPIIESLPSIRPLLAQYPFNSLHDWHFEILFIVAIIFHLAHIVLQQYLPNCDLKAPWQEKLRIVSSATNWPRALGSSRPSAPSYFTSGSAHTCGSSAEQESHSRKEQHCACGSERRAQRPQKIVEPGRLADRRAIELIDLVRVDHLHRIRCSVRGADARGRRRIFGNWRNRPSRSGGRKQTSTPAFVSERLLIRTRRGDRSRSSFWR
jgi:hypothetical protein